MHEKLLDICLRILMVREAGRCENCRRDIYKIGESPVILFAFPKKESPLYYNPRNQVLTCYGCTGVMGSDNVEGLVHVREGRGWWGFAKTVSDFDRPFVWTEGDMAALLKKLEYELEAYK